MSRGPSDNTLDLAERGIDWDDVYGFDYSCIKEIALKEPLVDCVELRSVATQPCAIRHIDIKTVKKEDLSFKVPFELKATRNDCTHCPALLDHVSTLLTADPADIHAFLGWFDISFSCCHKPIQFSTGPHAGMGSHTRLQER